MAEGAIAVICGEMSGMVRPEMLDETQHQPLTARR